MRFLPWLVILGLLFSTIWFRKQQDFTQKQLSALTDTLAFYQSYYHSSINEWWVPELDSIIGPKPLVLGDSLLEIHRIIWTLSTIYSFTIKEKKDSTVWLDYKHYGIKNPLTGAGRTELISAKTISITKSDFQQFRQKLAAIPFLDATRNEDWTCCWVTGSLDWEANFKKEGHL